MIFFERRVYGLIASLLIACGVSADRLAADQIVNGDFSAGNVGFTTGYSLVPANGTASTLPLGYGLTTNPGIGFVSNGYASYTDHTGNPGGLMLLADGYYPGTNVWAQTVSVAPSTTYSFTSWVASAFPANFAVLGLFEDGAQVGPSFSSPTTTGVWTKWTTTLTTGSGVSSIVLSIQDLNPTPYVPGDDFTLDDLSLSAGSSTATPEPSTLGLAALALLGCVAFKSRRIFANQSVA